MHKISNPIQSNLFVTQQLTIITNRRCINIKCQQGTKAGIDLLEQEPYIYIYEGKNENATSWHERATIISEIINDLA